MAKSVLSVLAWRWGMAWLLAGAESLTKFRASGLSNQPDVVNRDECIQGAAA